ncbi:ATP-binding protein [Secundilactobacillus muriivasis]
MGKNEHLILTKCSLRNFNYFHSLDITPAQNGNFALVGHNGVGKTNLVNCFIPLLINGSRSTPAFNTANEMVILAAHNETQVDTCEHLKAPFSVKSTLNPSD